MVGVSSVGLAIFKALSLRNLLSELAMGFSMLATSLLAHSATLELVAVFVLGLILGFMLGQFQIFISRLIKLISKADFRVVKRKPPDKVDHQF